MAALINKVWWYKPNKFTTTFTLTATFADGTTSVYTFNKSGLSWVATGSHDNRLLIVVPTEGNNTFRVRAFENDIFISLEATYANETSRSEAKPVQLKRISFPKNEYDNNAPFYQFSVHPVSGGAETGVDVWYLFDDSDLHDIFITNLTDHICLPKHASTYSTGNWQGWGLLNETCSIEHMTPRANVGGFDIMYMPTTEEVLLTYDGFPEVTGTMLKSILSQPCINNRFVMLPLYAPSGNHIWKQDRTDYRNK